MHTHHRVCATSGEVVEIPDAYEDSRFNQAIDKQTGYRTNNIIACPVKKNDGTVVAVMQAVNKLSGSFTESDIRLLNMFGKQTAVHINHAEMFESLQRNEEATQVLAFATPLTLTRLHHYSQLSTTFRHS